MSLLAHLVSEWRPRDAATTALAYILDPHASPGMAEVFVNLLGRTGVPAFPHGRVKHDTAQEDGSRPDVTISDVDGKPRVLVEATFWEGVEDAQPVGYLGQLPKDVPSALVFIAPRDRIPGLWTELKARCNDGPGIDLEEESSWDGEATWARTDRRVLVVASWTYVLDTLRRGAGDPEVQQDILQLQGLAERMEDEAFLPIARSEVTDVGLARRMMGYCGLVNKITDRLVADGVAHLKKVNWSEGSYQKGRMVNRSMQVHGKFDLRFGVELAAWRDSGLTPLWWVLTSSATYKTAGDWQRIKNCLDGVRSYDDSLYIPIRLKTGAEETRVIDDAVGQMSRVANKLLENVLA